MAANLNHCSRCGARLRFGAIDGEDRHRLACDMCGFIAYVNPRLVVTTIPITDDGRVVLLRRGIEPGLGWWAQPGGFLEIDETVSEGAVRETVVAGEPRPSVEALEVQAFEPESIPWSGIAFKTTYWALRDWMRLRHPEVDAELPEFGAE
jgi:hypothetical protein